MPLSERVYCVAVTFKMTEQIEQQICIQFCVKLEHSSLETAPGLSPINSVLTDAVKNFRPVSLLACKRSLSMLGSSRRAKQG